MSVRAVTGWVCGLPRLVLALTSIGAGLLAGGCSTVYAGTYNFDDGWREGSVIATGHAGSIAEPQFSDCRKRMTTEQLRTGQFALVRFQHLGHAQRRVVPRKDGTPLPQIGEEVYMNVSDCTAALVKK